MGAVHVRTPKNFVLEERLERYADAIETNPEVYVGDWREACAPVGSVSFTRLHLDLGCGVGKLMVMASSSPVANSCGSDAAPRGRTSALVSSCSQIFCAA